MSATAATKKQKPLKRHPSKLKQMSAYMILTIILISNAMESREYRRDQKALRGEDVK